MSGLTEITEASMVAAHQAGMAYWNRNKPYDATPENIKMLARTLGYHDADNESFCAGFYGAKKRSV
jgi:hypothetical protein